MAKLSILAGSTSKLLKIFVLNSSLTTGAGLTGLTNASGSLIAYYIREGDSSATAISLVSATVGTFTSSGFKEVDSAHMPGVYEIGIPNAAIASGAKSVLVMLSGATNMAPVLLEIELTATDNQDATRGGMTALPNANAGATNGLPLSVDSSGRVDVLKINGTSQTARDIGASVLLSSGTGTGQLSITSGQIQVQSGTGSGQISLSSGTVTLTAGQLTVKKNTALANYEFLMIDSADHVSPKTGRTVTASRSIDGGAFASCANSVTEVSNGIYKISLANTDLNGNVITLMFAASGADTTYDRILTQP